VSAALSGQNDAVPRLSFQHHGYYAIAGVRLRKVEFGTTSGTSAGRINTAFTLIGQHQRRSLLLRAVLRARIAPRLPWGILPDKKEVHVLSRPDRR
jgi:hypothetical protein